MRRWKLLGALALVLTVGVNLVIANALGNGTRLAGTWVCKTLGEDGKTVVVSELTFNDGMMPWTHPEIGGPKTERGPGRIDAGYGISKERRLFGVIDKVHGFAQAQEGEPFSAALSVDGDELTITDVRVIEPKRWPALKGVYHRKGAGK